MNGSSTLSNRCLMAYEKKTLVFETCCEAFHVSAEEVISKHRRSSPVMCSIPLTAATAYSVEVFFFLKNTYISLCDLISLRTVWSDHWEWGAIFRSLGRCTGGTVLGLNSHVQRCGCDLWLSPLSTGMPLHSWIRWNAQTRPRSKECTVLLLH